MQDDPNYELELDAYKTLIDWHKWTYDIYQKEYRLILSIEVILLGVVARGISSESLSGFASIAVLYTGIVFGIFIAVLWAGRQRRQLYLSKAKLEELKVIEGRLPDSFRYFREIFENSKVYLSSQKNVKIPLIGSKMRILPNPYAKQSFTHNVMIQQFFILVWLVLGGVITVRISA